MKKLTFLFIVAVMATVSASSQSSFTTDSVRADIIGASLYVQSRVASMPSGVVVAQGGAVAAIPEDLVNAPASLKGSLIADQSGNWWLAARLSLASISDQILREGVVWFEPAIVVGDSLYKAEPFMILIATEQMRLSTMDTTIQASPGDVVDLGLNPALFDTAWVVRAELWTDPTGGGTTYGTEAVDGGHQIPAEIGLGLYYTSVFVQPNMASFVGDDAYTVFGAPVQIYGPRVRVAGWTTGIGEARVHDLSDYAKNQFPELGVRFINNPFNNQISVEVVGDQPVTVMLGNTAAQLVCQVVVEPAGKWNVEINGLPSGLYTLIAIANGKRVTTLVRIE